MRSLVFYRYDFDSTKRFLSGEVLRSQSAWTPASSLLCGFAARSVSGLISMVGDFRLSSSLSLTIMLGLFRWSIGYEGWFRVLFGVGEAAFLLLLSQVVSSMLIACPTPLTPELGSHGLVTDLRFSKITLVDSVLWTVINWLCVSLWSLLASQNHLSSLWIGINPIFCRYIDGNGDCLLGLGGVSSVMLCCLQVRLVRGKYLEHSSMVI
ncbi:hypothetical protein Bca52824_026224 [Brassica carinata]|uniref:Uncharacterized protein n=1 Tax=Brassica carinata TaxID=52824 RepID=A0A8X7SHC4_BRACI|nr:hypothetical protein Bca52824_026224 [Brassica carinata]